MLLEKALNSYFLKWLATNEFLLKSKSNRRFIKTLPDHISSSPVDGGAKGVVVRNGRGAIWVLVRNGRRVIEVNGFPVSAFVFESFQFLIAAEGNVMVIATSSFTPLSCDVMLRAKGVVVDDVTSTVDPKLSE